MHALSIIIVSTDALFFFKFEFDFLGCGTKRPHARPNPSGSAPVDHNGSTGNVKAALAVGDIVRSFTQDGCKQGLENLLGVRFQTTARGKPPV